MATKYSNKQFNTDSGADAPPPVNWALCKITIDIP